MSNPKDTPIKQTDEKSHNDVMATMREGFDKQDDEGYVGIFWYNAKNKELFGVLKSFASDIPFNNKGKKTIHKLHKTYWDKQYHKAKAGNADKIFLTKDYTMIPRGRVFQCEQDNVFEVRVGKWIDGDVANIKKLIIDEFELHEQKVELVYDSHWDIGKGWSEGEYI